jgi:hypothetical protein
MVHAHSPSTHSLNLQGNEPSMHRALQGCFVHAQLKGTGSRDEYFLRVYKIKTALSVHEQMINEILG